MILTSDFVRTSMTSKAAHVLPASLTSWSGSLAPFPSQSMASTLLQLSICSLSTNGLVRFNPKFPSGFRDGFSLVPSLPPSCCSFIDGFEQFASCELAVLLKVI